ncbi:P-loop containing nucleoside triphosphate hydrolase protein [Aspergillus karnatakaensis]|uniref:P-loop containing nucleoside triphosphate hydrolase protein n=1 Tax=Aspergillus karnatakaensis TaxID=1810916 RepID=UPI003CCD7C96
MSSTKVFGELEENIKNGDRGFSSKRTMLADGTELNPKHCDYFILDACKISTVPQEQQQARIRFILEKYPLDAAQLEAFQAAVTRIVCGLCLIQGPPGTGKTRTALVIILVLACLDIKVMLAAGLNQAVDKLLQGVIDAIHEHEPIRSWIGTVTRSRTLSCQLAELRSGRRQVADSAIPPAYEMHHMVLDIAQKERVSGDNKSNRLIDLINQNRVRLLRGDAYKELRDSFKDTQATLFRSSRVVATTLSNTNEVFRAAFQPVFLVCDNSAQCLEGDHATAMTLPSLRAVTLVGDPQQLAPTVISKRQNRKRVKYETRSLMERLIKAGYPCLRLNNNYRNHPEILEYFSNSMYEGDINAIKRGGREDVSMDWDYSTGYQQVLHEPATTLTPSTASIERAGAIRVRIAELELELAPLRLEMEKLKIELAEEESSKQES